MTNLWWENTFTLTIWVGECIRDEKNKVSEDREVRVLSENNLPVLAINVDGDRIMKRNL